MNTDGRELWYTFRDKFADVVDNCRPAELDQAWRTAKRRTEFYTANVLGKLQSYLGMNLHRELFTVDYVMRREADGVAVPMIFIESENDIRGAVHEVEKLASIACPLKVLITVGEWSERWRHGGLRKEMTACWQHVVRVYHSQAPRVGIMGFLVGERHEHDLRFFAWALQPDGEFLEPESELVYVHLPTEGYTPIAKETAASTARGSV